MADITNNELRRLNISMLLIFLALLRHRNATLVAAELGLTQSGVSQAIKRLRDVFNDPLFLRRPHGMEPTAVALSLEAPVAAAVEGLRRALADQGPFDPAAATGVIRVSAFDIEQAAFLPGALKRLCHAAPQLRLSVLQLGRADAAQALAEGRIDLALGFFWNLPKTMLQTPLHTESYAVVGLPDLMGDPATMPMDRYLALPHLVVSPNGDLRGIVDETLARDGLVRDVRASVPQFFPALAILAEARCIATLPARMAHRYGPLFGLTCAAPPLPIRQFQVSALRHQRDAHNRQLDWFTKILRDAA